MSIVTTSLLLGRALARLGRFLIVERLARAARFVCRIGSRRRIDPDLTGQGRSLDSPVPIPSRSKGGRPCR